MKLRRTRAIPQPQNGTDRSFAVFVLDKLLGTRSPGEGDYGTWCDKRWPTVMLGSGWQSIDPNSRGVDELVRSIGKSVEEFPPTPAGRVSPFYATGIDGVEYADAARQYALALVADRLPRTLAALPTGDSEPLPAQFNWMAHTMLSSCLLGRLYHVLRASQSAPPRRWRDEDAVSTERTQIHWPVIRNSYTQMIAQGLEAAVNSVDSIAVALAIDGVNKQNLRDYFGNLLQRYQAPETAITVSLFDIDVLAEFNWISFAACLALKHDLLLYPGWSDILHYVDQPPDTTQMRRPHLNTIRSPNDIVRDRYTDLTKRRWKQIQDEARRSKLHESIADLAIAQAKAVANTGGSGDVLRPTTFLATFDLELELALLRRMRYDAEGPDGFNIVMPVNMQFDGDEKWAYPCWIRYTIKNSDVAGKSADECEKKLRLEGPYNQESLSIIIDPSNTDMKLPTCVHVLGCPVVSLPRDLSRCSSIRKELREKFAAAINERLPSPDAPEYSTTLEQVLDGMTFEHSLLLDDNAAIVSNRNDLIHGNRAVPEGMFDYHGMGLDPGLLANQLGTRRRYWILLGVALRDTPVKHRIATLVTVLPEMSDDKGNSSATPSGVIVNNNLNLCDANAFIWSEFIVVRDNAESATDLLKSLAKVTGATP